MKTNKELEHYLNNHGWDNSSYIVNSLIEGGFIEPDPDPEPGLTEPERIVKLVKEWCGIGNVFKYAVHWNDSDWKVVFKESDYTLDEDDRSRRLNIFKALIMLAREEGIEF
jgi:hypothetical protein